MKKYLILYAVLTVGCAVILPNLDFTNINAEGFSQFNWIFRELMTIPAP